jgi:hypothetical protein
VQGQPSRAWLSSSGTSWTSVGGYDRHLHSIVLIIPLFSDPIAEGIAEAAVSKGYFTEHQLLYTKPEIRAMKKTAAFLLLFGCALVAADFWQKPYMEWRDKDVTKMMNDSPWAKSVSVSMPAGPAGAGGAPPGAPGGGGGGGFGGHGGPQGGGGSEFGPGAPGSGPPSVDVVARWQSALPIRQAFVRLKFGAEADKSAEALKVLEQQDRPYEIVLSGAMGMFLGGKPGEAAKALSEVSSLSSSRTGEIKAVQIEVSKPGKTMDVLFAFPRTMPFTVDDKEVELTTKLGTSILKYKFKLKDMVVNGKLEM